MESIIFRRAKEEDLPRIAAINTSVFLGDRDKLTSALEWATCWFNAFPLYQYFVEVNGEVAGYAGWQMHGGFQRAEPVIELDQIGVDRAYQGKRLGPELMRTSIDELMRWVQSKNERIESHVAFVVWVYSNNFHAKDAYAKLFGDGDRGFRLQFGDRAELMLRLRRPIIRPIRDEA